MANTYKFFVLLVLLVVLATHARAQPVPPPILSKARIDSVRYRLKASVADTNRVNQLLSLGRFYLA
jgi:hypothetical protein